MKLMRWLPVICLLVFLPSAPGQLGLFAGFSAATTNIANDPWFYGASFGGYYNGLKLPLINVGVSARAAILRGSVSGSTPQQQFINGLAGPRAEFHLPLVPLKPYVEGRAGASNIEAGEGVARVDKTAFSYGFAGGADLTIFPGLAWRVAEYSYTRSSVYAGINQNTITTGLVLHVPVP